MNDVFISYSRKDKTFVERLFAALEQQGHDAWVDWDDIEFTVSLGRGKSLYSIVCQRLIYEFWFIYSPE
jgi:TIR domain-containing protein